MKKHLRRSLLGISLLLLGCLFYLFLWGRLFPYSPITPGFSKHELSQAIFLIQQGTHFDDFRTIDGLIPAVEAAHGLKFTRKPRIFIFRDKTSYLRRSVSRARFYAYPNGSLLISPWAMQEATDGKISLPIYISHELSHILLMQHMGILEAYIYYPRWLMEGVAVYTARQLGTSWYPSKEETYALIRQGNFMPPEYFKTKKEDQVTLHVPYPNAFVYSQFACMVDYLIATQGNEKFWRYAKSLLTNRHHDRVFEEIYGFGFQTFVLRFQSAVTTDERKPPKV